MTNNNNLDKRVKNSNHLCTIHRKTTNSFIPLGSRGRDRMVVGFITTCATSADHN